MCIEHAKAKRDSFRGAKNEESSDEGEECERDGRRQRDRDRETSASASASRVR